MPPYDHPLFGSPTAEKILRRIQTGSAVNLFEKVPKKYRNHRMLQITPDQGMACNVL